MIISLHVTHLSAGVSGLQGAVEKLKSAVDDISMLIPDAEEHVVLCTCNRLEIYVGTLRPELVRKSFEELVRNNIPYRKDGASYFILEGRDSVDHLFRVVCGLDSLMVGEDQIQHQVKKAFLDGVEEGHVGRRMRTIFERALSVGKRVRTETALNNGSVSIGSAAVALAEDHLGSLKGRNIAIMGAGEMATLIAKALKDREPNTVFVSNRTYERACELAHKLDGVAVGKDRVEEVIAQSDVILVATAAPHLLLRREEVERAVTVTGRRLLIVDISMPSNVDPCVSEIPGVELCRMDGLERIAMENLNRRRSAVVEAERIVMDELSDYEISRKEEEAQSLITQLSLRLAEIRRQEVCRACNRLQSSNDPDQVLDDFSRALVSKIMATPYSRLKEACRNGESDLCRTAELLFLNEAQR